MKCTSCGATLPKGALFCTACGAPAPKEPAAQGSGTPCPQCGATIPAGNLFCTVCGAKAAPVQQPRETVQQQSGYTAVPRPAETGTPCPVCGKPVPDGYAFCTGCGTPVAGKAAAAPASAPIVCWSCGATVPASNRFCNACGADMDQMPVTAKEVHAAKPKKSHTGLWITLICLLLAAVAAFAVLFFTGALDDILGVEREDTEESDRRDEDDEDDEDEDDADSAAATEAPEETDDAAAEESPEPSEEPEAVDYLLPDSSTRAVTEADLQDLSWRELCLARNEIFARHGRIFKTPEIAAYFESKDWYDGRYSEVTLSSLETQNVNFIIAYENKHFGGSYY